MSTNKMMILLGDNLQHVFVDREKELEFLEKQYSLFRKGLVHGVLIYGIRRVGKTRLINEFLRSKAYISINCGGLSTTHAFFYELTIIAHHKFEAKKVVDRWIGTFETTHTEKMRFKVALSFLVDLTNSVGPYIVFLDEFHLFIDKIASRVAREEKTNRERALLDLFWILKGIIENSNVFWILAASIGWEKLREFMQMKHRESPLMGVLTQLEVKPLEYPSGVELARTINNNLDEATAEEIAKLSGGIPKIIIEIASRMRPYETPVKAALRLLEDGAFDDIFDNIIRYAADLTKFDYTTIMGTIGIISEEKRTMRDISKFLGFDTRVVATILQELYKLELVEKIGERPAKYRVKYPLMEAWVILKLKDRPLRDKMRRAIATLGLTVEAYVRELFMEAKGREISLWDDKIGSILAGTTEAIKIEPTRIMSRKETTEFLSKLNIKNGDIIIETKDGYILVEVKAGIKDLDPDEIDRLAAITDKLTKKLGVKVRGILVYMGEGKIPPTASVKAKKYEVVIMTKNAVRLVAKKLDYPTL